MSGLHRRLIDFGLYLLIAAALFSVVIAYASASDSGGAERLARWGGLLAHTGMLYGCIIRACRESWRLWAFWVPLFTLLFMHLLIFAVLLLVLESWKGIWFLVIYPVETPLILWACDWSLGRFYAKKKN